MTEVRTGVWRLRVVDRYLANGRPHQLSRTINGTKRVAESSLAKFVAEVEGGTAPTAGRLSYADYLRDRWLPHIAATREPLTLKNHTGRAEKRIIPLLGHIRLDKLGSADIDRALRHWEGQGFKPATTLCFFMTISASLEQAVKWGMIPRNVARLATRPRQVRRPSTMPTLDEVDALVDAATPHDPVLAAAVMLAAMTGLRRGEILGLQWRHVGPVLTVEQAVKRVTGRTFVGAPKTRRTRHVSLDKATVEWLAEYRAQRALVGLDGDNDYLFSWGSQPANPESLTGRFEALAKRVGVRCRFHDLRHAVATNLLAAGVDVATVARRLGHSDATTTLRTYAHALAEADLAAAGVMSGLLKKRE